MAAMIPLGSVSLTPDTSVVPEVNSSIAKVVNNNTLTADDSDFHKPTSDEIFFVLIPVFLIMALAFFSGIILACSQRRRRSDGLRHRLDRMIPVYNFITEDDEDSDEWGLLADQESSSRTNLDVVDLRQ